MAQLNSRSLTPTLRTPASSSRDSDDVLVALETARSLEVRGDIVEAVRWLRRAANEAEKQGNDARVLVIAHAAADLSSASAPGSRIRATVAKAAPPPLAPPREPQDSEPTLHWRATPPPLPPSASSTPAPASRPISVLRQRAIAPETPVVDAEPPAAPRQPRMGALRVALTTGPNARSFTVERLDSGQPLPPGTVEALLVVSSDVDAFAQGDADILPAAGRK
jgi:hypothetical protein